MDVSGWECMADALDRASIEREVIHLESPQQIVNYYQQEYDGKWSRELAKAIQPYTRGKNGQPMKLENIQRGFQPSRLEKTLATRKNAGQYREVGKQLPGTIVEKPKKVSGKRAHVKTRIKIMVSKDKRPRPRNIDEILTPSQMSQLRHADLTGLIDAYGGLNPDEILSLGFDSCNVTYL